MRQRIEYIDEISGLLIVAMVVIHIAYHVDFGSDFLLRLFFFFMAWFYFKAGLFYKPTYSKDLVRRGWRKMMKPYISFTIISLGVALILSPNTSTLVDNGKVLLTSGAVIANIPLWFLPSLLVVRLIGNEMIIRVGKTGLGGGKIILVLLMLLSGYALNNVGFKRPEWIAYNILGLGFYLSGYFLKNYLEDRKVIVASFLPVLTNYLILPSFIHIKSNRIECGNYFLWYISSIAACVIIVYLWKKFKLHFPPLLVTGKHAMLILCSHWIILMVLENSVLFQLSAIYRFLSFVLIILFFEVLLCRCRKELFIEKLF